MAAKVENVFSLSEKVNYNKNLVLNDFKCEKDMQSFIDYHARLFARDVLEIEYKSHVKEYYLGVSINPRLKIGNQPRVDFVFESIDKSLILVECKKVRTSFSELIHAIGQLLAYKCIAKSNGINISRMCIVSNIHDERIRLVINEFNLPIEVYLLSKTQILKLVN